MNKNSLHLKTDFNIISKNLTLDLQKTLTNKNMAISNFNFYNPVRIVFGKGEISKLGELIPKGIKVMMTYGGGSIKKNGVYDQVIKALAGYDIIEFGGIEPNPKVETLRKAIEIGKKENIGFLLPVGGGSVIDGTKLIAAAICIDNDPWDILTGKAKVNKAIPIGTVLTLPATGSEMNAGSVISNIATQEKFAFHSTHVMPKFSILDPETCYSLPDIQIANGIIDAFIHVMEQYMTYPVNAQINDRFSEAILQTLIEVGPKALADKTNYEHMSNYKWSATVALNGLNGTGVQTYWATHQIGHEITAFHGVDHGQTLAIVLPGVMSVMREGKKDKILQFGARIFGITAGTEQEKIDETIGKMDSFFRQMGVNTKLSEYGIGEETIEKIVDRFAKRGYNMGERADISPEKLREILINRL